jgi:protein-disulfide isomerase
MKMSKSTTNNYLIGFAVIIIALLGYYFFSADKSTSKATAEVNVSLDDHIRGNKDAIVTLVEFGDFQCPACGAYEPMVRKVVADNAQDVRFVFRHFPLTQIHQNALLASKYAEAASIQGKFWEMHDVLYDKQQDWSSSLGAKALFEGYAKTLGLDVAKLSSDAASKEVESKILAQYKEGVKLEVQGTPTFFINGKKLESNPRTPEEFTALIKDAKKAVGSNTAPAK